jgi:hypothetical protein
LHLGVNAERSTHNFIPERSDGCWLTPCAAQLGAVDAADVEAAADIEAADTELETVTL